MNRTQQEKTEIKATDLVLLMSVVEAAAGLYNELERAKTQMTFTLSNDPDVWVAWGDLGEALRSLGLPEVTDDDAS